MSKLYIWQRANLFKVSNLVWGGKKIVTVVYSSLQRQRERERERESLEM
jgi:hypothetical protein